MIELMVTDGVFQTPSWYKIRYITSGLLSLACYKLKYSSELFDILFIILQYYIVYLA